MPQQHDHSYKQMYSYPEMIKDLLTGFVHQDWVGQALECR